MKLAALILFATACGSTIHATDINSAPRPLAARPVETVEVFSSGPPLRPHTDLTYFEAERQSGFSSDDVPDFIAKMRVAAARRGCDGLVIGGISHEAQSSGFDNERVTSSKHLTATCIVYTDLPPQYAASK